MRRIIGWVSDGAKMGDARKIIHPHLLAFGLAFREITASIKSRAGEPVHPPLPGPSELNEKDLLFVTNALEALLRWAEDPVYSLPSKRVRVKRA